MSCRSVLRRVTELLLEFSPSAYLTDAQLSRLTRIPGLRIQGAEAVVAVGLEGAHAQLLGQSEGLVVVHFGLRTLQGLAPRRDLAKEAQGIRLVDTLLVFTGECQGALGEGVCLLQAARQHLRL